jgi:hypothetical protein
MTQLQALVHPGSVDCQTPAPWSADLPDRLDFSGEFGAEVNSFLPFVHWLHCAGLMAERRIRTYRGMRAFYFFLADEQIEEVDIPRHYVFPDDRPTWLPNRNDHAATRSAFELFPDYRGHFRDGLFDVGRPLLIVHNKVTPEWGKPPVNIFPLPLLNRLFDELSEAFHLVYLRPGLLGTPAGYSADHQPDLPFDDLALLRRHRHVEVFDEMAQALAATMSYNEAKLRLYAHADFHVTVQGGNAHLLTMFKGGMVAILHRAGQELRHSYANGHFSYAATPPPRWLICRSEADILRSVKLFRSAVIADGQVMLPPEHAATLLALSPKSQQRPFHA